MKAKTIAVPVDTLKSILQYAECECEYLYEMRSKGYDEAKDYKRALAIVQTVQKLLK